MSKKRRRRKSSSESFSVRKKRSGLRTFIETFMGVAIGLMILAFLGWWYLLRKEPEPISVSQTNNSVIKDNVVDSTESYEAIRDVGSLDEQKHLLSQLDNWPRDATTPVRIDTLSKRLEIAQTILKRDDISETDRVATAKIVLNAMGQIYGISLVEGLDSDGEIYQKFYDISNEFIGDKDPSVKREADLSLTKAICYEYTKDSQIKDLEAVKNSIQSIITSYPEDNLIASTVRLVTKRVKAIDPNSGFEVMRMVISSYDAKASKSKEIATITRQMRDEILLADSGISKLAREAVETKKFDKYIEKLGELADQTGTGVDVVNRIYRAISYFEANGQNDKALEILKLLQRKAADRTDAAARIQALRICKFGFIRNEQLGKPMDLADTSSNGQPLAVEKFKDVPTLLLFYSPNDPVNPNLFADLRELQTLIATTGTRIITISVDNANTDNLDLGLNPAWDNVSSSPENPSQIFMRCPVSHIPFFALVDTEGKLAAINVQSSTLKTKIETLVSGSKLVPAGKSPETTSKEGI